MPKTSTPTPTTHTPTPWTVETLKREMDYPGRVERIVNTLNLHGELLTLLKEARNRMIGSSPAITSLAKRTDDAIAKAVGL